MKIGSSSLLIFWLAAAITMGCGGARAPEPTAIRASAEPEPAPAPSSVPVPQRTPEPNPEPKGPASLEIHIEPGKRQPLELLGNVLAITPPRGSEGLDTWTEVSLAGTSGPEKFYLLIAPADLKLPFAVGERIRLEIDCRKGGWHRVCDGVVSDMTRKVLLISSGSGSDTIAKGWKVDRGAVATSEVRAGPERSVLHTHALRFESAGASVTALPHEWKRLLVHGKHYLVSGYEEVWEGVRPPDARDHRVFAIVYERTTVTLTDPRGRGTIGERDGRAQHRRAHPG